MRTVISEDEAVELLKRLVELTGGTNKLAAELEVTPSFISSMTNGRTAITGVVAKRLKLKRVYGYELTVTEDNPKQEQYANARREWLEQNGMDPFDQTGIR